MPPDSSSFHHRGTDETQAENELFCSDFDISEVRKCSPERFASETESSVRFVPEIVPFNPRNPHL
jgi:hypothetical protein